MKCLFDLHIALTCSVFLKSLIQFSVPPLGTRIGWLCTLSSASHAWLELWHESCKWYSLLTLWTCQGAYPNTLYLMLPQPYIRITQYISAEPDRRNAGRSPQVLPRVLYRSIILHLESTWSRKYGHSELSFRRDDPLWVPNIKSLIPLVQSYSGCFGQFLLYSSYPYSQWNQTKWREKDFYNIESRIMFNLEHLNVEWHGGKFRDYLGMCFKAGEPEAYYGVVFGG